MESKSNIDKTYVNTNPFSANKEIKTGGRQTDNKQGKRPRILKPVYSVRLC